jgi:hypothetical protein
MTTLSLVVLSCAALFLFARPDGAQNLPGKTGSTNHTASAAVAKSARASSVADDRQDLSFYTSNVRDGMFSQPLPPDTKAAAAAAALKAKTPVKTMNVPTVPINPFAQWSYTGTVHMGDITMALLENTQTREGQYVKPGDRFMGAQVKAITDQQVTLTNAGKPSLLAKADTINVTPLNQDAPGKNQPVQQAAPQQVQATPTTPTAVTFTLPNGQVLEGDRAQRMIDRLNRGYGGGNGGGGNGGGGFGGGFGGGGRGGGGRRGGGGGFGGGNGG